jgi:uncharacterized protein YndB with AHSA1/START domain
MSMKIDVEKLFGAVRRQFIRRQYQGQPAVSVILQRTFDTSVDDLWTAVTTQDRLAKWLGPIEGELRLGGRFHLKGNASGDITACEPPRHLAVTWELMGNLSWVEVTLAREGERARLVLEHIAPDVDHPHAK